MIYLLFVIVLLNFLIGCKIFKPSINPTTIFVLGFLGSSLVCLLYVEEWNLGSFHLNTFIFLGLGISIFTATCWLTDNLKKRKKFVAKLGKSKFKIDNRFLIICIILNILVQYWYYTFVLTYSGSSDIFEALYELNDSTLKQGEEFEIPFLLRNLRLLFEGFTYYLLLITANYLVDKRYKHALLPALFITVSFIGGFLSSSRGGPISMIVFFFICYGLILYKKRKRSNSITLKKIIQYSLFGICSIILFLKSTEWVGREVGDMGNQNYLAIYCGAEIKNLDTYINESNHISPSLGEYSFRNLPFVDTEKLQRITTFRTEGDYVLGNVYTCFQIYYQDFGFVGAIIMIVIMASIMQGLFRRAKNSSKLNCKLFDFNIFLYGYMGRHLFMSFFSDRFYNSFSTGTLKLIIEVAIIDYIIDKYYKNAIKSNNYGKITNVGDTNL